MYCEVLIIQNLPVITIYLLELNTTWVNIETQMYWQVCIFGDNMDVIFAPH